LAILGRERRPANGQGYVETRPELVNQRVQSSICLTDPNVAERSELSPHLDASRLYLSVTFRDAYEKDVTHRRNSYPFGKY